MPTLPKECNSVAVSIGQSGNVKLSYGSLKLDDDGEIISVLKIYTPNGSNDVPKMIWPWVSGYEPTASDWKSIGFFANGMFDSCFGSPDPKYMFTDWLDK
jgi:hypothetical protein